MSMQSDKDDGAEVILKLFVYVSLLAMCIGVWIAIGKAIGVVP